MRNGILATLVFCAAAQLAHAQGYYPGAALPYAPAMMPYTGYVYPAYYAPQSYYRPYGSPAYSSQSYYPYSGTAASPPAMPDNPALPAPPAVPPLPVCPPAPCEPTTMTKLGPACGCGLGCGLGCSSCDSCGPSWSDCPKNPDQSPGGYCVYTKLEVLYWWLKNQQVSGLTDTGNTGSTISVPGYSLDLNSVVPDYNTLLDLNHVGLRGTLGFWLDPENTWAIEGIAFVTMESPSPYYASGGPTAALTAAQLSSLASVLGITNAQAATLAAGLTDKNVVGAGGVFAGGEVNLRHEICRSPYGHIDWLLGARMLELYEAGGVLDSYGAVLAITQNQFWGGQVGLDGELSRGRFYVDGVGKVALGVNHEIVSIGSTATSPGSLSAYEGNQGVYNRDVFTTVGEFGLTAGVRIGCNARLFANYTIIYMTDAVRPLLQVAPYLGNATPGFSFNSTSFWAQGVSLGFEMRF